jgi:hypothetical protein
VGGKEVVRGAGEREEKKGGIEEGEVDGDVRISIQ